MTFSCETQVTILDLVLSKKLWGPSEGGQGVQTAFANNPAGLQSRLSKAVELPERTGQQIHCMSKASEMIHTATPTNKRFRGQMCHRALAPSVAQQSVLIYRDVKASRTFIHNKYSPPLGLTSHYTEGSVCGSSYFQICAKQKEKN